MYQQEITFFNSLVFFAIIIHGFLSVIEITKYVFYINRDSDHQYHHWPFRTSWREFLFSIVATVLAMSWVGHRFSDFQFNFLQILFGIYYTIGFIYVSKIKS